MIKKGLDLSLAGCGLGGIAVGAVAMFLGLFTDIASRISTNPFTGWVLVGVGAVIALVGAGVLVASFRQSKCAGCNASLTPALAAFPLTTERAVMAAFTTGNPAILAGLPMGSHAEKNITVAFDHCKKCRSVGVLTVSRLDGGTVHLAKDQVMNGPFVGPLADNMLARQEAHEARYAES